MSVESPLVGTFEHQSSENFDQFLSQPGIPMPVRLLATILKPSIYIRKEGPTNWTLITFSGIMAYNHSEFQFSEGAESEQSWFLFAFLLRINLAL
jgi:hypothetical protein